jgi:DNA polymerase
MGAQIPFDPTKLPYGTVIDLGAGQVSTVLASGDFETYSEAGFYRDIASGKIKGEGGQGKGGLPVVNTPNYVSHPSAEALCFFYDLKDGLGRRGWIQGGPPPLDLFEFLARGGLIEAWNVTFELWVWNQVCVRAYGWPPLPLSQCRCVMARARRHSLPGALGNAAKVLGTPGKDKAGGNLIQKLTRPHTPTKNREAIRWTPETAPQDFMHFYAYCDRDVEAEDHAAAKIPDLTPYELDMWLTDQTINLRGVNVDMAALDACLEIERQTREKYNAELYELTDCNVPTADSLPSLGKWLVEQGVRLPDLQAETITEALERDDLPPNAYRALQIRDSLGAANVKKLTTLKLQVSSDGRLRNQYTYCGADRTGRASAGGVQLQNITSKGPKTFDCESCGRIFGAHHHASCPHCQCFLTKERPDWTVEAVQEALGAIMTRDLATVEYFFGDPIEVLCGCLRGLFTAAEDKELICVDFSAVEAVVAACLSRCQWRIDVFNTHGKIYEMSAAKISGVPFEEIIGHKERTGQDHKLRKTLGKVAELASGYGGWIGAWCNFGADSFMNEKEMKAAILAWRAESPEIVEMWGGQFRQTGPRMSDGHPELYGLEGAAISAILRPGETYSFYDISYFVENDILFCVLPSGRRLTYHRPKLMHKDGRYGLPDSYKITFEGHNSNSAKGKVGWHVLETYGGRLFENVVQATAADLQFEALGRCEKAGYSIVMHTHDEGTAETPKGWGSVEGMTAIMIERPAWAAWWPIRGDGWVHKRYQK